MTLEETKLKITKVKENNYQMMKMLVEGTANPAHCGYKTVEEGLVKCMKECIKDVEKIMVAYEKANPIT